MKPIIILASAIALICSSCNNQKKENQKSIEIKETKKDNSTPPAHQFVKSLLRNKIKLKLNASVEDVWSVIGRLERMPEYSAGLIKLDAQYDVQGKCTNCTCFFKPEVKGGRLHTHTETVLWYESNVGYISLASEPNFTKQKQSLSRIIVERLPEQTILSWEICFNAESKDILNENLGNFEQALNVDISQNLIKQFGGIVLVNYIFCD